MEKKSLEYSQPKPVEVKTIEVNTWGEFEKALDGWVCSVDGDDYCPECWENYKQRARDDGMEEKYIEDGNVPATKMARYRKCREGWLVTCYDEDCGKSVFRPKPEK